MRLFINVFTYLGFDLIKTRRSCLPHVCLYAPVQRISQPSNNTSKEKDRQERMPQSCVLFPFLESAVSQNRLWEGTYNYTGQDVGQTLSDGKLELASRTVETLSHAYL